MATRTSYVIAGILAAGLAAWLASGQVGGAGSGDVAVETPSPAPTPALLTVRVRDLVAEGIEREIVINGKTEPLRRVELRAETNGRVIEITAREGRAVDQDDVLVRLDARDREAAKLEAEALLRQRWIELDAARKLGEKGFQAETSVALAEANFAAAEAALRRAELDLEHTHVKAPFAGILDRRHVEIGDFVDVGDRIAVVLDQDPYLVTGEVTETEVGVLEPGLPEEREGKLTFGTANNPYKLTAELIELWAKVMAAVPDSRFLFIRPEGGSAAFRTNIGQAFESHGIAAARIFYAPVRGTHLPYYNKIDIALDTGPHTGGTTTCESLWMGVPTVTLIGPSFFERLSYSNLSNAG
ncbi:MAG: HlyD family efflux transporter periplasmic adaptor subunit, partial [Rhizobiales bacterium]|nr:HlyD family efflux transporter periplasmic adaptor subunit [Hyphomicrobiales bacterium]